jgi:hypothetical protein
LIEPFTWDYGMMLITNPELFEQKLRHAQAQEYQTIRPKQKELEHIVTSIKQSEKEADDIARAMTKTNGLVALILPQQAHEVDWRYHAFIARKMELQEALTFNDDID